MHRRRLMNFAGVVLVACAAGELLPSRARAADQGALDKLFVKPENRAALRLWDQEPALWDEARKYQLVRPLSPVFGWEGPRATVYEPREAKGGVNISNERLEASLWGTPERLVLSLGKTDLYTRARLDPYQGKKPVGQLLLLADDFSGAAQSEVSTSIHNGENVLHLTQGKATADVRVLLSDRETNIIAIKASYANLTRPLAVRLYRHQDTTGALSAPQGGKDGGYFWVRQEFAKDKTFPDGFDYYFVAKVTGAKADLQVVNMQANLGAPVPACRDNKTPGSAATAQIPAASRQNLLVYATVVTRAESADPLAEARKRLAAAEACGYAGLLAQKEAWCRALYARREQGRIFTGNFADVKEVVLPFIHQSNHQSRHTFNSNPDPARYEADAGYNILECDKAAWCGLQCFNEELYTGDFVAGRDETVADYYVKLFNLWRPAWEANAKSRGFNGLLVLRGYVPPIRNDIYWSPDWPANDPHACDWATMVWSFKNVWDAWDYGAHDLVFLRDKVYPSLRGIADFFVSKSVPGADGYCHIEPSQIREEDMGRDAVDCIAAAKWAFRCAIQASIQLQVDADKRAIWKSRLEKMAPYYVIKDGNGDPIFASLVKDGKPVVAGHGTTHFIVNVADEINLESAEQDKQIAIRSNQFHYEQPMNRQVEFLLGKSPDVLCMTSVMGNPAWMIYYAQKVKAGDFSRVLPLKTRPQKAIACWLEPERLCNSRSGTIFLFPCVPGNFDVAFKEFQARGGFLVTGELKSGVVTYARIKARRTTVCRVMNPWPGKELRIYEWPGDIRVAATQDGAKYSFPSIAGKEYDLSTSGTAGGPTGGPFRASPSNVASQKPGR